MHGRSSNGPLVMARRDNAPATRKQLSGIDTAIAVALHPFQRGVASGVQPGVERRHVAIERIDRGDADQIEAFLGGAELERGGALLRGHSPALSAAHRICALHRDLPPSKYCTVRAR